MTEEKPTSPETQNPLPQSASAAPVGVAAAASAASGDFPAELQGWNWGAFFLNWIWGIGNRVWISLLVLPLALIPFLGGIGVLVMMIVLGLKGNEWAWKNRHFESVEQFRAVQKTWALWGVIIFVLGLVASAFFFTALIAALSEV